MRSRARWSLLAAFACLAMWTATPAPAATVSVTGRTLTYTAAPGEASKLWIHYELSYYEIQEQQAPLTAGAGCTGSGSGTHCTTDIDTMNIDLGDGNDYLQMFNDCAPSPCRSGVVTIPVTIDGGAGDDTILGGGGSDLIVGGPGRDTITGSTGPDDIRLRDGAATDAVTCGDGSDIVQGDPGERVPTDCESIDNGTPDSPAGPLGVSINDGSQFTNDPNVTLSMRWPRLAAFATVSNDGGFGASQQFTVADTIPWKLAESGPERLPKTVYLRFSGGDSGPETYQDDIILDQTPPEIESVGLPAAAARTTSITTSTRAVRVKATDDNSGVASVESAMTKTTPSSPVSFRPTVSVPKNARYIRVVDYAGNRSSWAALPWVATISLLHELVRTGSPVVVLVRSRAAVRRTVSVRVIGAGIRRSTAKTLAKRRATLKGKLLRVAVGAAHLRRGRYVALVTTDGQTVARPFSVR